ncbi:type IV secretion system protein [Bartonella sp. CB169]|uniref:type IV secretion system protein n=1 Tax=Bartonella sp. CB169 TaxID=3112257 RepID=UPI00300DBF7E
MLENIDFFAKTEAALMQPLTEVMTNTIKYLANGLSTPLFLSCTIYVIVLGYNTIYGRSSTPMWEFMATTVKLAIITTLTTHAPDYNAWVTHIFFEDLPNAISNLTQGLSSDKNVWDNMINHARAHVFETANKHTGWTEIGTFIVSWVAGFVCIFIIGFFCTIGFIVSMLSKFGLFLVLSLGPLFIGLYLFSTTRRFTEAWLGQLVNFVILQILVVLLGGVYVKIAVNILSANIEDIILTVTQFLTIGIGGIYLFTHLPAIASALAAGGASLTGATHLAHHASKPVVRTVAATGGAASRAGMRGASKLISKIRGMF